MLTLNETVESIDRKIETTKKELSKVEPARQRLPGVVKDVHYATEALAALADAKAKAAKVINRPNVVSPSSSHVANIDAAISHIASLQATYEQEQREVKRRAESAGALQKQLADLEQAKTDREKQVKRLRAGGIKGMIAGGPYGDKDTPKFSIADLALLRLSIGEASGARDEYKRLATERTEKAKDEIEKWATSNEVITYGLKTIRWAIQSGGSHYEPTTKGCALYRTIGTKSAGGVHHYEIDDNARILALPFAPDVVGGWLRTFPIKHRGVVGLEDEEVHLTLQPNNHIEARIVIRRGVSQ